MRTITAAALIALSLAAPPTLARQAPKASEAVNVSAPTRPPSWVRPSSPDDDELLEIDFPGGTLGEFYRGVGATPSAKRLLPLVISEQADGVRFQPVRLSDVGVFTLYQLPPKLVGGVSFEALTGSKKDGTSEIAAYVVGVDPSIAARGPVAPAPTFDLEFPGGTIAAYADAIRKTWPAANIVIMDGAGKETLPPVSFRSVSLDAATKTMEIRRRNADGTVTEVFVRGLGMGGDGSQEVYKVEMETTAPNPMAAEVARVWSLAVPIANGTKVEDLLSAIEAALGVSDRPTTIKYHEATSLLIVRALPSQQDLVDEVIRKVAGTTAARKMTPDNGAR